MGEVQLSFLLLRSFNCHRGCGNLPSTFKQPVAVGPGPGLQLWTWAKTWAQGHTGTTGGQGGQEGQGGQGLRFGTGAASFFANSISEKPLCQRVCTKTGKDCNFQGIKARPSQLCRIGCVSIAPWWCTRQLTQS